MKTELRVDFRQGEFQVYVLCNGKATACTTFQTAEQVEEAASELVAKARSGAVKALALENKLNELLGGDQ